MRDHYTRKGPAQLRGTYARCSPYYIRLSMRRARSSKPVQFGKVYTDGVLAEKHEAERIVQYYNDSFGFWRAPGTVVEQ